jgi:hypothetical protein
MSPSIVEEEMLTSYMDQVTTRPPGAVVLAQSTFSPNALLQFGRMGSPSRRIPSQRAVASGQFIRCGAIAIPMSKRIRSVAGW